MRNIPLYPIHITSIRLHERTPYILYEDNRPYLVRLPLLYLRKNCFSGIVAGKVSNNYY